jgi:hypothetical protein
MNKTFRYQLLGGAISLGLLLVWLIPSSCVSVNIANGATQSDFMLAFSIDELIKANEQYIIARHTGWSESESDLQTSFFQLHEQVILDMEPDQTPAFMHAIKMDILDTLSQSGVEIEGIGTGGQTVAQHFSYRYSKDDIHGVIHVWGVRGKGTEFILIVLIIEN